MQEAVPVGIGAMAAILKVSYDDVKSALAKVEQGVVEIANWNSEEQIVIAGDEQAVKDALAILNPPRSVFLPVSAPFHCQLMAPAERRLSFDLDEVEFQDLEFPVITNVDARMIYKGSEARDSLKKQVTRPVLWYKSMELLKDSQYDFFVEVGSGKVLSGLLKRIGREWSQSPVSLNVSDPDSLASARETIS